MPSFDSWYRPSESNHQSYEQEHTVHPSSTPITRNPGHRSNHHNFDSSASMEYGNEDMELDESVHGDNIKPPVIDLTEEGEINPLEDSKKNSPPPLPPIFSPEHAPPPPKESVEEAFAASPLNPIEIGELLDKAEINVKKSKVIDSYLAQGQTDSCADHQSGSSHRHWWLTDPISSSAGILYFTYTPPPTLKNKEDIKIENILKDTSHNLDREPWKTDSTSWYDPLYGDLATHTGIYDSIKEILKKRKKRWPRKKV